MKKVFILILCLCLMLCCTACVFNMETGTTKTPSDPTTEPTNDTIFIDNMPYILRFDSFDELVELWELQDADEETVQAYLWDFESRNFLVNGLESKEDIVEMFDEIGGWKIPYIAQESGFQLKELSYSPNRGTMDIEYYTSFELKRNEFLLFSYSPNYDYTPKGEAVGNITIAGETVSLHDEPTFNNKYQLLGKVGTTPRMTMYYSINYKTMDEIQHDVAQHITVMTLAELIQQHHSA